MKRKIIVTIDCEDELCGECNWRIVGSYSDNIDWCDAFSDNSDGLQEIVGGKRVQRCLDAEVRMKCGDCDLIDREDWHDCPHDCSRSEAPACFSFILKKVQP